MPSRRTVLRRIGALSVVGAAGCAGRSPPILDRDRAQRVALSIKAPPVDADPYAITIAQHLAGNLRRVGVAVEVVPMAEQQLLSDVLIEGKFDLYVSSHPGGIDPDFLRPLLHSRYAEEPGWQNPFGYSDVETDRLLRRQARQIGSEREETVATLLRQIARQQPFTPIASPHETAVARTDRYADWPPGGLTSPLSYLSIERRSGLADPAESPLRVAIHDGQVTENRNPIAVDLQSRRTILGLVYDPLGRPDGGGIHPWLARDWRWRRDDDADGLVALVRLRDGVRWHDGRPLTARDVAFTYRFLADTSLGRRDTAVPAPLYRGRVSLVDAVDAVDDATVRFAFGQTSLTVAKRSFTVSILPEAEWSDRTAPATVGGVAFDESTTQALVWNNPKPVGSGPFRFERATPGERLVLGAFEDHFSADDPIGYRGASLSAAPVEEIHFRVAPTDFAAVDLVQDGDADVTAGRATARSLEKVERDPEVDRLVAPSNAFYHIGYNTRRTPLDDAEFRRALASLIDKRTIAEDVFDGYARPTTSPLGWTDWLPSDLAWRGFDPMVPFFGTAGELDVRRARNVFVEAGYRYDEEGRLRHG